MKFSHIFFVIFLSFSTVSYSLDRTDAHRYVDNVADTYHSLRSRIKRRLVKIWHWNTIQEEDYQEYKLLLEELEKRENELENLQEQYRSSIKDVPNHIYAYIKVLIDKLKAKRDRLQAERRVRIYEQQNS